MPNTTVVSIHEAKARFDALLDRVSHGAEIVITLGGKPVARLSPIPAKRKPLPYGLLKRKLTVKADFNEPLPSQIAGKQKSAHSLPPTLAQPKPQRQRGRVKGIDDSAFFERLERVGNKSPTPPG